MPEFAEAFQTGNSSVLLAPASTLRNIVPLSGREENDTMREICGYNVSNKTEHMKYNLISEISRAIFDLLFLFTKVPERDQSLTLDLRILNRWTNK